VRATQSFENALKDQNSYVQNAILYQTRSELVSLGEKMPQLENKFEVYQAIQSFSRSGEALGQDNIDHLTTPLFEGLQKGGITESGSKNVANGIETAIKSGDGALFSASLTHQFSQKATENYTGGKIPEENKKNIALSERFTNAIMDSLEKVKKNYDKANANFQNHAKVLSQASTNFPQFTEDEVAAGIDSYRQANREDFQSYENASKVLASTLEGASYIESENFFKVTRKDNVMNAQVNFEETKAVLEKTPELIQSESGYQALKSALIRNAQESTFLKTATQIAENYPLYEKKLDFALNYTSQRATQELSENISVNSYNQIKNLHQGTSKAVTNPELKSVYSDSANLTSEIISDTSSSLSSYTTMASEIEKLIGNRVPPDLAELGRSFTLYAAGANTYKFYKNPNAENSLDLLESSMDVGGLIKPGSKLFARGNLIISGAMSVHELSEGDIAGAFTDALPIAGLACGPAAPACIAGGAVLSSVIDVSRTIYQNSTRPYQKDLQPYLEGALTEMNNHEADLNLNSEKIKDVAYRLRDVNGDFLSANQGLEAYAQATGLDSRELFKSLIQQDDKEIKDFVNDTIRAIPDMEENSTQLYFDEASLQTIQESYNEATSNDHTYKIERKSKLGVPISDTKANESVA
ncbi:MAG: hypothetical protein H7A32_05990, partial [Deltaproteobacteria bacterium]|nr:hypothetical protein [Deltaproteobacteria bacterium]